ncbi:PSP1 [Rubrobacter xylanophilus DSM 9941]|uniref:PSP1 n=1 Tax=Rubrobacter xylanophilus (strain DSM 9941 / JCM 11954 / NBRC 16129 / PRD-1) TaxID=266117 RepID=Q1AUM1_RUBXD|nr:regulatory iron-sulfur-containing complex subunit RicT [Rubrobacter xylanophilus]ABG04907.1 PSP1 [Rubrobacter xylanophilus DSM 9941]
MRIPGWGTPRLCYARDLDLRVGYRVVVQTELGEFIGKVALTPRRRQPHTRPYDILRLATEEDLREDDRHRERGREIRNEAQKLARDHRIEKVFFIGCDLSLDGSYVEVKYQADRETDLTPVREGIERRYGVRAALRRFTFIERSGSAGGCDTCGRPLCCAVWSGARSLGPVNIRLAKQQGVTPNEKIIGCCGEVKCCMRYEHEVYKEFKERAPFKNSRVRLGEREGRVVDYSMVRDAVFVKFGPQRDDTELVPLSRLARYNEGIRPADAPDGEEEEAS